MSTVLEEQLAANPLDTDDIDDLCSPIGDFPPIDDYTKPQIDQETPSDHPGRPITPPDTDHPPCPKARHRSWLHRRDTATMGPRPDELPPPIPDHVTRLLLGNIETTVENKHDLRLSKLKTLRDKRVKTFQRNDPHRQATDWINSLARCTDQFALFQVDGELQVHPIRCRKRACPICESKRMTMWWHRIHGFSRLMTAPKHVSLSIRSSDTPLGDQIAHLVHCWKQLRQRNLWKSRTPWGVWLIEVTYNENTGRWHPHLHIVCNMCFLDHKLLRSAWRKITGGSWDVHISAIQGDIAGEVTKYIAKASNIFEAPVDPFQINAILKGKRMVQPFGKWPKLPKEPEQKVKFLGTLAELVWKGRCGDQRARILCEIVRDRWPKAMLAAIALPRPPPAPGRAPKRPPYANPPV